MEVVPDEARTKGCLEASDGCGGAGSGRGGVWGCGGSSVRTVTSVRTVASVAQHTRTKETVPAFCSGSQLAVRVRRSISIAQQDDQYISFTNIGARSCTLSGWPTIIAVTTAGRKVRVHRTRSTMSEPNVRGVPKVVLNRGQHAEAVFANIDGEGPSERCYGVFQTLVVRPPHSDHLFHLPARNEVGGRLPYCLAPWMTMVVAPSDLYRG